MNKRFFAVMGFSLIEILMVLTIIGMLSSLALPLYQRTQQRGQRSLAKLALLKTAHWLERAASIQGSYPEAKDIPVNLLLPEGLHYQLTVTSSDQSFIISAQPTGTQSNDPCGTLTLSHTGERNTKNATLDAVQCWSR